MISVGYIYKTGGTGYIYIECIWNILTPYEVWDILIQWGVQRISTEKRDNSTSK